MNLETLMRDTARVDEPEPHALAVGRAALDAVTQASVRPVAAVHGRARTTRRRRTVRAGFAAVIVAAAGLAVVFGPTVNLGGHRPGASAEAAQVLMRAGASAGAQPGGWPNAEYWHSVSRHRQGSGPTYRREIWIGHHKVGVLEDPGVEAGVIRLGVALFPAGSNGLTWDQLYALPVESHALERKLRAGINGAGPDDNSELFTIVGDLLRESPAPPALRQALWEVAARIPGVTLVGAVTDGAGRHGVAVERGGQRYVLDPNDGRLLEESEPGGWRATYLEQGPTSTAPTPTTSGSRP
ncbi:MAG TPA: CU044_5270 family protein [Acidimicrobiia bacterium]